MNSRSSCCTSMAGMAARLYLRAQLLSQTATAAGPFVFNPFNATEARHLRSRRQRRACASRPLPRPSSRRSATRSLRATPACPAKPCLALTRTTGYQAKIGTKRGTHVDPPRRTARRLVDHARQARQEADQVLRRQPRWRRQRAGSRSCAPEPSCATASSPRATPRSSLPYFGTTVQFALDRSIPVKKGYVVAITTPTWVPALPSTCRRTRPGARRARRARVTRRPSRPRRPVPTSWRSTTACTAAPASRTARPSFRTRSRPK